MKLTEQKVIADIAAALDLDIPKDATLESTRLEILGAIDRHNFFVECRDKENKFVRRKVSTWRAISKNFLRNPF